MFRATSLVAVGLAWALGSAAIADDWTEKASTDGITVYNRAHPGSDVREIKAVAVIDAPPKAAWAVIRDYEHYKDHMPYTEESRIVSTEEGGKVTFFYSLVNAPLVSRRDYTIRLVDESDWKDGKGYLKSTWSFSTKGPPARDGVVRVTQNDGYWLLEPQNDGSKTLATYWLFTDPGGSIPTWIANKANSGAVPDIFRSIRKFAVQPPYRDAK
jgi:hypothetical protein